MREMQKEDKAVRRWMHLLARPFICGAQHRRRLLQQQRCHAHSDRLGWEWCTDAVFAGAYGAIPLGC